MAHISINFRSSALNMPVMMDVLLPENCKNCKTLYLLHGMGGDRESWLLRSRVADYVEGKQIAVVMPSGNNKFFANNINGKAYQSFVTEELIAQVEKWFAVSRKAEDRFVAGADMGGFGALLAAVEHPALYHTAWSYHGLFYMQALCENADARMLKTVFGSKEQSEDVLSELVKKLEVAKEQGNTNFVILNTHEPFEKGIDWTYLDDCIKKTIDYIVAGGNVTWQ